MHRIKRADVPTVTATLLKKQSYTCPLCKGSLKASAKKDPVLDHDHKDGHIRDVLCRNCNGIEGKVFNLSRRAKNGMTEMQWLANLVRYWHRHQEAQHGVTHHTHLTAEEKRLARNKKARLKRARAKRG